MPIYMYWHMKVLWWWYQLTWHDIIWYNMTDNTYEWAYESTVMLISVIWCDAIDHVTSYYIVSYFCLLSDVTLWCLISNQEVKTALMLASYCNNVDVIRLLLDKGADIREKDEVSINMYWHMKVLRQRYQLKWYDMIW